MTLVIIPARMGSSRLPGKPLAKIGNLKLIERCVGQARKAGYDPIVATDSQEIANRFDGHTIVVMTGECASGTDRVAEAADRLDPDGKHEFVINYQGDMPFLDPEDLKRFVGFREQSSANIVTAYCNLEYVQCFPEFRRMDACFHIGLYGYTRSALKWFAAMAPSEEEKAERLEQLRGPGNVFTWAYAMFHSMPIEINTQTDLDRARAICQA